MNKKLRLLFSILLIAISSFMQCFILETMMRPMNIISMGFTGLSILLNMGLGLINIHIPLSVFLVLLNLPVAIICAKSISKKFTLLSVLQIGLTSLFLEIFHFPKIFDNILLVLTLGAFIYGLALVLALKAGGSTGGTDFIALYVSNKIGKAIWEYVFIFNAVILLVFGYLFGWDYAGYSILFQYITTKTVSTFYIRYSRATIQIITRKPDEIIEQYTKKVYHGITRTDGVGGYSKQPVSILYTVVSSYEVSEIVKLLKTIDKDILINVYKTEDFHGNFHLDPL